MHSTHRTHPACLSCQCLPFGHDAVLDGTRSGLPGVAVGGAFFHAANLPFFPNF